MKYFETAIILTAMMIVSFSMESCKKDTNQAVADAIPIKDTNQAGAGGISSKDTWTII